MKKIQINEKLMSNRRIVIMTNTVTVSRLKIRCFFIDFLSREQIKTFKDMSIEVIEKTMQRQKLNRLKRGDVINLGGYDFKVDVIREDYVRLLPLIIEEKGVYNFEKTIENEIDFPF